MAENVSLQPIKRSKSISQSETARFVLANRKNDKDRRGKEVHLCRLV